MMVRQRDLAPSSGVAVVGSRAMSILRDIYPYCRSITGNGVRATLRRIGNEVPLTVCEVPTGTTVLDWVVPDEWNVTDAYVADSEGRRVIDFRRHNLHLVGYSEPIRARMSLDELQPHLHSLPDKPDWIPYRTSYYRRTWGFCLSQRERDALSPGHYDVVIDSELAPGHLTYGELLIEGQSDEEVLLSTHVCHPSLANDNCAGIAALAVVAGELLERKPRLSYRILFLPGTIGAITWLSRNQGDAVRRIRCGLVMGLLGDRAPLTFKRSRRGDTEIDRIAIASVRHRGGDSRVLDFSPYGYDERQFCSPGFDLAVGRLTRSFNDSYAEYHTSADGLDLVDDQSLSESIECVLRIADTLESNVRYVNTSPLGEPRLGVRGLFRAQGGRDPSTFEHALLWLLNQSDGEHGVQDIAIASGLDPTLLDSAALELLRCGLLRPALTPGRS